ncbi:hypothetical protein I306_00945 [Cryptococcus gattii EJB2]|uniref:Membrane insertase YidC/Oxa/ALB C-terminal domain-containing protein n=1 Tax=Cryptococcus gattii EJB2 TaxID=1296103 RepID=A0ABR5C321_9TREE|nr:hypothetical protein I306_00945 [Cryptococcus gattii EJB2]
MFGLRIGTTTLSASQVVRSANSMPTSRKLSTLIPAFTPRPTLLPSIERPSLISAKKMRPNQLRLLSSASAAPAAVETRLASPADLPLEPLHEPLLQPASTFLDPLVHPLSDALLSIPHPLGYGTTLILLTLIVRTAFTLPVSLWQKKRAKKMQSIIAPEMKAINEHLAETVAKECRKKGVGYAEYLVELRRQLRKAQKAVHKKHNIHPWVTTWAPLMAHIPIFVTLSLTIRRALDLPGSPMASESFLWLDSLGQADGYGILPLVGMAVAFGNAEVVGRRVKDVRDALEGKVSNEKKVGISAAPVPQSRHIPKPESLKGDINARPSPLFARSPPVTTGSSSHNNQTRGLSTSVSLTAQRQTRWKAPTNSLIMGKDNGLVEVGPNDKAPTFSLARQAEFRRSFFAGILRFSAIGFAMIASQMPSGVVLYWFTSLCYSFVQNFFLSVLPQMRLEKQRKEAISN